MNKKLLGAVLAVAGLTACGSMAKTTGEKRTERKVASAPRAGYQVFVPSSVTGEQVPAVVVIHGCLQSADEIAAGTRWNRLAEEKGFIVVYPNQKKGRHPLNCWRWFTPENQTPNTGESGEIVEAIEEVKARYPVDPKRVFVAGMSSGAATTAILMSCYPSLFAAGAAHSGPPYGWVQNETEAVALLKNGPVKKTFAAPCEPRNFKGGVMVVQGLQDKVVHPGNADQIMTDFVGPESQAKPVALIGDAKTMRYQQTDYLVSGRLRGRKVIVSQLDHSWSGGLEGLRFNAPKGPDATALIWSFFEESAAAR